MAHMINKPIAWNHVNRGGSEFWTHKHWSIVKNTDGTYDVLCDGSALHTSEPDLSKAFVRADVLIRNSVGL